MCSLFKINITPLKPDERSKRNTQLADGQRRLKFYTAKAPTAESITRLVQVIAKRVNKHLLKKGYLEEFEDLTVLGNTEDIFSAQRDDVHLPAQGASVGYRIAFGPQAGQPVRRIKTSHSTWPAEDDVEATADACVKAGGYSVSHKGTSCGRTLRRQ